MTNGGKNDNPFKIPKEKVAETVKTMSKLMNCNYKTAWEKYTHTLVKMNATWEEIESLLFESGAE